MFFGCASNDKPEVSSATIDYYFANDTAFGEGTANFSTGNAVWTIENAMFVAGEIGIHWEEPNAPRGLRHDVPGGKISPKIYGYFAVDLLKTQNIQKLKVPDEGKYSHTHIIITNDEYVKTLGDTVKNIKYYPQLKGRSFYFSGKVGDDKTQYPFELYSHETFDENSMGDITFNLPVYKGDEFSFYISPKLERWFTPIRFELLRPNEDGKIIIHETGNATAYMAFRQRFTENKSMNLVIKNEKK
jgi:hypothetical protein